MPVIFETDGAGTSPVQYLHFPLSRYYLRQSADHAKASQQTAVDEHTFKESLLAVLFASLSLECFANERAEDSLSGDELESFLRAGGRSVPSKLKMLFQTTWNVSLSMKKSPLKEVGELFELRNQLVHYKLTESAGKAHMPQGRVEQFANGIAMNIDFTAQPTKIEPPFIESINARAAAESYNAALALIKRWHVEEKAPRDSLADFPECPAPPIQPEQK